LLVGGILLYAGAQKIGHGGDLATIIASYRVVDPELVNLPAIALPGIEIIVGALLLLGLFRRSAALVAAGIFLAFAVAIALALARGISGPCGCFSSAADSEQMGWSIVVRDGMLLLLTLYLLSSPTSRIEVDAVRMRRRTAAQ
jgi:uncharacterized membrane protein YphA (DoxX/SURF4 family)